MKKDSEDLTRELKRRSKRLSAYLSQTQHDSPNIISTIFLFSKLLQVISVDPFEIIKDDKLLKKIESRICSSIFSANLLPLGQDLLSSLIKETVDLKLTTYQIAHLYEAEASKAETKAGGVFYTPQDIVEKITDDALKLHINSPQKTNLTILDPACGVGLFLLRALSFLHDRCLASTASEFYNLILKSLYGIDIDNTAVEFTRTLIALEILKRFPELERIDLRKNIFTGNSLVDSDDVSKNEYQHINPFPLNQLRSRVKGFDIVIGNPPYGLSRDGGITTDELAILSRIYRKDVQNKLNKYILFIIRSLHLLNPCGILSFIVPNAWLGIKSGELLRKHLLKEGYLRRVQIFHYRVFKDPSVEPVIVTIQNTKSTSCFFHITHLYKEKNYSTRILFKDCLRHVSAVIPLASENNSSKILQKIEKSSKRLIEFGLFEPRIALQAYAKGKGNPIQDSHTVATHPFHSMKRMNDTYHPYLDGKDIRRYEITWGGKYLSYGNWLAEPQSFNFFNGPRLVFREILGAFPYVFIGAYTNKTFLYNKSVLHILPNSFCSKEDLLTLLLLLNSKVGSFLLAMRGQKAQRSVFPKILNNDLKNFPLPVGWDKTRKIFSPFFKIILESQKQADTNYLKKEADRIAFRAYGLNKADMHEVENFLIKKIR